MAVTGKLCDKGLAKHLHCGRGAAGPAVVLVDEAAHAEGPPRLVHVAVQVSDRHDTGHRREHRRPNLRLTRREVVCNTYGNNRATQHSAKPLEKTDTVLSMHVLRVIQRGDCVQQAEAPP